MSQETPRGFPDFSEFQSDEIEIFADPERAWKGKWGWNLELGDRVRDALETVIHSLEGLTSPETENLHEILKESRELWMWSIDWWYCKDAVDRIPDIVRRFGRLEPILTRITSSQEVNRYLREATQCFLYGFFQASTALSRCAMEAGLNEHLTRVLGSTPNIGLSKKVEQAARYALISAPTEGMARDVIAAAGMVLHKSPANAGLAFDTLSRSRGVLKELYGENNC